MAILFWIILFILLSWTLAKSSERRQAFSRSSEDWWIDLINLAIHLIGLPLFQALVLIILLQNFFPTYEKSLPIGPLGSFFLYVLLDYIWYWNHRLLHSYSWIWNLHAVHHSAKQVDIFATARNSVWSHAFEIYMWFIALATFLLEDPSWFIGFVIFGSMINFWTHTNLTFGRESKAYLLLSKVFITPHEHLWHHSTSHSNRNYGTVFSLWDRLHGTLHAPVPLPDQYGNEYLSGAFRQLVVPIPPPKKAES